LNGLLRWLKDQGGTTEMSNAPSSCGAAVENLANLGASESW